MSDHPDISVVMGVYNAAPSLRETLESILSQKGVSLEFVIVNDGSTDDTPLILEECARLDSRIKIIHQSNAGLTKALIKGCAAAQGKYIARQDAGDISLPGRLVKQLAFIKRREDAAFVSCRTRFVGPAGEYLYEAKQNPDNATKYLRTFELAKIQGPSHHSSTMFSRSLYQYTGGYRSAFYFAQDIDLWVRLAEHGEHEVMADVLYQSSVTVGSISSIYRKEQINTVRLILQSARLRHARLSDLDVLEMAEAIKPDPKKRVGKVRRSKALYFIGMCLRDAHNPEATRYFKKALLTNPLHLKSVVRLVLG